MENLSIRRMIDIVAEADRPKRPAKLVFDAGLRRHKFHKYAREIAEWAYAELGLKKELRFSPFDSAAGQAAAGYIWEEHRIFLDLSQYCETAAGGRPEPDAGFLEHLFHEMAHARQYETKQKQHRGFSSIAEMEAAHPAALRGNLRSHGLTIWEQDDRILDLHLHRQGEVWYRLRPGEDPVRDIKAIMSRQSVPYEMLPWEADARRGAADLAVKYRTRMRNERKSRPDEWEDVPREYWSRTTGVLHHLTFDYATVEVRDDRTGNAAVYEAAPRISLFGDSVTLQAPGGEPIKVTENEWRRMLAAGRFDLPELQGEVVGIRSMKGTVRTIRGD